MEMKSKTFEATFAFKLAEDGREFWDVVVDLMADEKLESRHRCCQTVAKFAAERGLLQRPGVEDFLLGMADATLKNSCCALGAPIAAAKGGHLETVAALVGAISDAELKDECCKETATVLINLGRLNDIGFVASIADRQLRNRCCWAAAGIAAASGRLADVTTLVKEIADVQLRQQCCQETMEAAAKGGYLADISSVLSDITDQQLKNHCCSEAALVAARKCDLDLMRQLTKLISDPRLADSCCDKLIKFCAVGGRLDAVEFLVDAIDNPELRSRCCNEAAVLAGTSGKFVTTNYLVQKIANLELRTQCCQDVMECAAHAGRFSDADLVLSSIKDRQLRNSCFPEAAVVAAVAGNFVAMNALVAAITDRKVKSQACEEAAGHAAKHLTDAQSEAMTSLRDQELRNACCSEVAKLAVFNGNFETADRFFQAVTDNSVKLHACNATIDRLKRFGRHQILKSEALAIADPMLRDRFVKLAMQNEAARGSLDSLSILASAISDQRKDKCCQKAAKLVVSKGDINFDLEIMRQEIKDQVLMDHFCCEMAKLEATEGYQSLESISLLVAAISSDRLKQECCKEVIKEVTKDRRIGNLQNASAAISSIADAQLMDLFCKKSAKVATESGHLDTLSFLIQGISDDELRDRCCKKCAGILVENGHLFDMGSISAVSLPQLRDECTRELAKMEAAKGESETVALLLQTIEREETRRLCFAQTTKAAAMSGNLETVSFLVNEISDEELKIDCCHQSAIAAIENCFLELSDRLVQAISDPAIKRQCCQKVAEVGGKNDCLKHGADDILEVQDVELRFYLTLEGLRAAAAHGDFEGAAKLVPTLEESQTRTETCVEAARIAASCGHFATADFLVQAIDDIILKAECCAEAAELAAKNDELTDEDAILDIDDELLKSYCCNEAARIKAKAGDLNTTDLLVQCITDPELKSQCCAEAAKIWVTSGSTIPVAEVLQDISDAQLKTSCCSEAARAAANSDNMDGVTSFVAVLANQLKSDGDSLHGLLCTWISASQIVLAAAVLPHVPDVSIQDAMSGSTALMLASEEGHNELVVALLDRGAPLEAADGHNRTALLRASKAGQVRTVRTLLDRGANSQHCDTDGLTCRQLAEQNRRSEVLRLFIDANNEESSIPNREIPLTVEDVSNTSDTFSELEQQKLSRQLHDQLNRAGFTSSRAECLQKMARFLERIARLLTGDNRELTGSFAEGWGNSLVQVNGRTAADSDIDCTILLAAEQQHLQGRCRCPADRAVTQLAVTEGHAQMGQSGAMLVQTPAGSQPAVAVPASGTRPAQDTCHAYPCCSDYGDNRLDKLHLDRNDLVHLVRATRPNTANELRVSFSFKERRIMRQLNTIHGQLFVVIKFIFKTLLPKIMKIPLSAMEPRAAAATGTA